MSSTVAGANQKSCFQPPNTYKYLINALLIQNKRPKIAHHCVAEQPWKSSVICSTTINYMLIIWVVEKNNKQSGQKTQNKQQTEYLMCWKLNVEHCWGFQHSSILGHNAQQLSILFGLQCWPAHSHIKEQIWTSNHYKIQKCSINHIYTVYATVPMVEWAHDYIIIVYN